MCYSLHVAVNVCINCSFVHFYSNQLDSAVLNAYLWTESKRNLPPLCVLWALLRPKCVCGRSCPSPRTPPPLSALQASSFGPSGRAFPLFLFYETTTDGTRASSINLAPEGTLPSVPPLKFACHTKNFVI